MVFTNFNILPYMNVSLPKLKFQLLAILLLTVIGLKSFAQTSRKPDVIIMRNDSKLEVHIQEVDDNLVKYRKISDPEGPLFSVKKTEISSIRYGNGEVETFEATLEVPSYYSPDKPAQQAPQSATTTAVPKSGNKFLDEIRASTPDRLRATYKYYKSRSKAGMVMGIAGTSAGMIVAAIGTGILVGATDSYGTFATYQDEQRAKTGAIMMLGGFAGAVTFGTVGFVKAGKNGSKASRIKRELLRRNEPITFNFTPGFNPGSGAALLTMRVQF